LLKQRDIVYSRSAGLSMGNPNLYKKNLCTAKNPARSRKSGDGAGAGRTRDQPMRRLSRGTR